MAENKSIKRKLIIQSFMPLFVILAVKNFDMGLFGFFKGLAECLAEKEWSSLLRIPWHPLFLKCVFEIVCIVWTVCAVHSIFEFADIQTANFVSQNESVTECENVSDTGVSFFVTYVLPMVMDDIGTIKGFLVFMLLMVMLYILMWRTNLYYQNPVLMILNYDIVSFKFEHTQLRDFEGKTCVGITRKTNVRNGMKIKRQYVSDNVFLIYKDV